VTHSVQELLDFFKDQIFFFADSFFLPIRWKVTENLQNFQYKSRFSLKRSRSFLVQQIFCLQEH